MKKILLLLLREWRHSIFVGNFTKLLVDPVVSAFHFFLGKFVNQLSSERILESWI